MLKKPQNLLLLFNVIYLFCYLLLFIIVNLLLWYLNIFRTEVIFCNKNCRDPEKVP